MSRHQVGGEARELRPEPDHAGSKALNRAIQDRSHLASTPVGPAGGAGGGVSLAGAAVKINPFSFPPVDAAPRLKKNH